MRYATTQIDPLELDRRAYESLFDLMEAYRAEHPEVSDDECYEAVCFRQPMNKPTDYAQERSRDR
jgi:hypothetical protein